METKKSYNFSEIDYKKLSIIADFKLQTERTIFNEWFSYKYEISEFELKYITNLLDVNEYYLQYYTEHQLRARFISPFLSIVNLNTDKFKSWFEYELSGTVNGYELRGNPDFMIASGDILPKKPYFFFQEFKKSKTNSNPDFQLLSEMAVAIEINKINIIRGVYNIGRHWFFIILEKIDEGKYQYYESVSFDCLKINDLKQIYINLQAVKELFCKD